MKKSNTNSSLSISVNNLNAVKASDGQVEVLYQKMGDRWFAFSLIDDEVFLGSVTQAEVESAGAKDSKITESNEVEDFEPRA